MLGLATAMGAYLVLLTLAAYLTVSGRLDEVRIGQAVWRVPAFRPSAVQ